MGDPTQKVVPAAGDVNPQSAPADDAPKVSFVTKILAVIKSCLWLGVFIFLSGIDKPLTRARNYQAYEDPTTTPNGSPWMLKEDNKIQRRNEEGQLLFHSLPMTANMISFWWSLILLIALTVVNLTRYGFDGIKTSFHWKQLLIMLPAVLCFSASKIPNIVCADFVSADVQAVIASFDTVAIAVVCFLLGRHKYSKIQWMALAGITVAVPLYAVAESLNKNYYNDQNELVKLKGWLGKSTAHTDFIDNKLYKDIVKEQNKIKEDNNDAIIGILLCLCTMVFMVSGGVFGEISFKAKHPITGNKMPFVQQKHADSLITFLFFAITGLCAWPFIPNEGKLGRALHDGSMWGEDNGYFGAMKYSTTWLYMAVSIAKGVVTSFIVKQLDATVKQVGKTSAQFFIFLICIWWGNAGWIKKEPPQGLVNWLALAAVMLACLIYAFNTAYTKHNNKTAALYNELKEMQNEMEAPVEPSDKAESNEKAHLLPK